jgi:ketosteroid isomerase-like protein
VVCKGSRFARGTPRATLRPQVIREALGRSGRKGEKKTLESFRWNARWVRPGPIALFACLVAAGLLGFGCSAPVDAMDDESGIVALLEAESRLAVAGDIDGLLSLYVQDDKNARLSVTKSVSAMITGWDAVREHQVSLLNSSWMNWEDKQFSKENLWIKVNGDNAWAVCDNVWTWREEDQKKRFQNIQITVCERQQGDWKIAFQAFVRDPEHMEIVDIQ